MNSLSGLGRGARRRRCAGALAAPLALVALLAGCGSSTEATAVNRAREAPSVLLAATLTLTGPASVNAQFVDDVSTAAAAPTCADAVKGFNQDGPRYDPPRPPLSQALDGHTVGILLHLRGYAGPTSYQLASVAGEPGAAGLVTLDGAGYTVAKESKVTVVVRADDSGVLSFDHLVPGQPLPPTAGATPPPPPRSPAPLSGTLTWTCTTQRPPAATATPAPLSPTAAPSATPTAAPAPTPTPTPTRRPRPPRPTPSPSPHH